MIRFIGFRLVRGLVTIWLVMTFSFVVLRISGDPAIEILSVEAPPEAIMAFRTAWGLDAPLSVQYLNYLEAVLHGDFGRSMRDGRDALKVVVERIPATLELTLPALFFHILIGVPAGVYAALRRNSFVDRLVMTGAIIGFTIPSFVLSLLLILVFSIGLKLLPTGGADGYGSFILPVATLAISGSAVLARFTRSAMLEVLGQAFIRTGSAKGMPWRHVVFRHALPNAAIPTLTVIGFMVGSVIAGAVLTENVFAWPGIGRLLVVSVSSRDVAVVQCILIIVALTMIVANMVVDVLYGLVDPRMRVTSGRRGSAP